MAGSAADTKDRKSEQVTDLSLLMRVINTSNAFNPFTFHFSNTKKY